MPTVHDIEAAQATYNKFIRGALWGTGFCVLVVAFVVGLIAS